MGVGYIWNMDLPALLGSAQGTRCPPLFRALHDHGQVEGFRDRENEGRGQQESP